MARNLDSYYQDHWVEIEPERMERYEAMFQWRDGHEALIAPAEVGEGHVVVDYGSGPGATAIELARRVGPSGRVWALDINREFLKRTQERAEQEGLGQRVSAELVEKDRLPLPDQSADRVVCKNVLEYVPDLDATLSELRRVLAPGGRIHIMDSDWGFVIVEPWGKENVDRYFGAASIAFREPHIGRKARGLLVRHGFVDVDVRISAFADTSGRSLSMISNMRSYIDAALAADDGDAVGLTAAEADGLVASAESAVEEGTFLFSLPQFLVSGNKAA